MSDSAPYESPILSALPGPRRPGPTACTGCRRAVWYVLPKGLRCFCRVMHAESYTSERPNERIETCDGLFMGVMEE